MIQELQSSLLKLKKEVSEIVSEKEIKQSELEHKLKSLNNEFEITLDERNKFF